MELLDKIDAIAAERVGSTPPARPMPAAGGFGRFMHAGAQPPESSPTPGPSPIVVPISAPIRTPVASAAINGDEHHELAIVDRFAGPEDLDQICDALEEATEISIDLETTHLTPWSAPIAAGKSAKIGTGQTINQYQHETGCSIDERPRARIVAIETDNALVAAVDLDLLDESQIERLIRAAARPEAVRVGHNLGFDLHWLHLHARRANPGQIDLRPLTDEQDACGAPKSMIPISVPSCFGACGTGGRH